MNTRLVRSVVLGSCVLTAATAARGDDPSGPGNPDMAAAVSGNNQFAFDLYSKLAGQEEGNLFFSPYSISSALAMTYAGARSTTAAEMAQTLHFTLPQEQLHPAMGGLIGDFSGGQREGCQLNVANRLWGQEGSDFLPEFLDTTREHYGAELARVDYIGHTEQARETINQWVEEQTEEKIKNLIPEGILSSDTRLVLTNAIYFQGDWKYQFDKQLTQDAPFAVSPGQQITVPMMHQTSRFNYADLPQCQILEMPYDGEDLSMLALLPKEVDGEAGLDEWLTADTLDECLDQLYSTNVHVFLPKFQMTTQFKLKEQLEALGMPEAFSDSADFSGMTGQRDLKISEVLHKAFVQLDEEGTEAAAATAVIMDRTTTSVGGPPPLPVFRADHPFTFMIRDNSTGSILFLGRVTEPETIAAATVPEPSTLVLLAAAAFGLLAYAWRRRAAQV